MVLGLVGRGGARAGGGGSDHSPSLPAGGGKGRVVFILRDIDRVEHFSNQLSSLEAGIS